MREVRVKTPNYACDLSGICSALYELGGLIVMHDASGCNSTFATHDEPRWYDVDSMVYISGLTEYDAVLGNDDAYIDDVVEIALERHPRFVAVFGSPVALLMGTDFRGVARIIERRCGIPTFWFKTSGMESYITEEMERIAPNLAATTGPLVGARLIHSAGGLRRLAGLPSSTVQVLGAEKAFFRFLREGGRPPKHGILFQHPSVHSAPTGLRGRMARTMAASASLASRLDAYGGTGGSEIRKRMEGKRT